MRSAIQDVLSGRAASQRAQTGLELELDLAWGNNCPMSSNFWDTLDTLGSVGSASHVARRWRFCTFRMTCPGDESMGVRVGLTADIVIH